MNLRKVSGIGSVRAALQCMISMLTSSYPHYVLLFMYFPKFLSLYKMQIICSKVHKNPNVAESCCEVLRSLLLTKEGHDAATSNNFIYFVIQIELFFKNIYTVMNIDFISETTCRLNSIKKIEVSHDNFTFILGLSDIEASYLSPLLNDRRQKRPYSVNLCADSLKRAMRFWCPQDDSESHFKWISELTTALLGSFQSETCFFRLLIPVVQHEVTYF